jgi:phosphate starvation-inducible protein PhoH
LLKNIKKPKTIRAGSRFERTAPFAHKGVPMSKRKIKANEAQKQSHFELRKIAPLTPNQSKTFAAYNSGMHLMLHGYAGTGKSYISLYLALNEVLNSPIYEKIIIVRSVVPSRDIGFLPGNIKEKIRVYEEPYKEICDDLFGRGDGYDILKLKGIVNFTTTSFLRGMTFNKAIVIVDELQNMCFSEIDTVMTRMGDQSRIVFCGDFRQTDLVNEKEKTGILKFINITKQMSKFEYVEFEKNDIIRSGIVKDYIIKRTEMGL